LETREHIVSNIDKLHAEKVFMVKLKNRLRGGKF
jgi:hypothetical protein